MYFLYLTMLWNIAAYRYMIMLWNSTTCFLWKQNNKQIDNIDKKKLAKKYLANVKRRVWTSWPTELFQFFLWFYPRILKSKIKKVHPNSDFRYEIVRVIIYGERSFKTSFFLSFFICLLLWPSSQISKKINGRVSHSRFWPNFLVYRPNIIKLGYFDASCCQNHHSLIH